MKHVRSLLALASSLFASAALADNFAEKFATNPLAHGWAIYGASSPFQWNQAAHNLAVTWDSAQPDSFLYHPLDTILAADDAFALAFDLQLADATGYGYSCQLAVDLLRFNDATNAVYSHSAGTLPNVCEFAYFPGTDTVADSLDATLIDAQDNYYFTYANQALTPGVTYSIQVTHPAGATTVTGQVFTNGVLFSSLDIAYPGALTDFRLDTVAISCFQDDGYGDSILAHGTIANLVVTLPPPPVRDFTGFLTNGQWTATFTSRTNWVYTLERSLDLQTWAAVNSGTPGNGTQVVIYDPAAPATRAFYRVNAQRP